MKKPLLVILFLVIVLSAVLAYRAETLFVDRQLEPANGITAVDINKAEVLRHFSDALKIKTISHDDRSNFDAAAFTGFHDFLQNVYPLVHTHSKRVVINNYSLVYQAIRFYYHLIRQSAEA